MPELVTEYATVFKGNIKLKARKNFHILKKKMQHFRSKVLIIYLC